MYPVNNMNSENTKDLGQRVLKLSLVLAFLSYSQFVSASDKNLRVDLEVQTGEVFTIEEDAGTLWLATEKGLFKWNGQLDRVPEKVPAITTAVYALLKDDNTLWIGTAQGLFRWDNAGRGEGPQFIPGSPKSISQLHKLGTKLLIGADNGLYVWQSSSPNGVTRVSIAGGFVNAFSRDGDNKVWIGAEKGLLIWDSEDELPKTVPATDVVGVTGLYKDVETATLMIGTANGLLRWVDAPSGRPEPVLPNVKVYSLYKDRSMLLISLQKVNIEKEGLIEKDSREREGLFRLDNMRAGKPTLVSKDVMTSFKYFRNGPVLWMGAGPAGSRGLYRWDSEKEAAPRRIETINTGTVHDFLQGGKTLWICAERGLFRLEGLETGWDAKLKITSEFPDILYTDNNLLIRWEIGNYGWRTTPEEVRTRVVVKGEAGEVRLEGAEATGRNEFTLPPLPKGKYTIKIQAIDLHGEESTSPEIDLQVYSSLDDVITSWAKWIGLVVGVTYSVANILAFITLLVLSRWSRQAFEIFTRKSVRVFSIYFGFVLYHSSTIRVWVFERYYDELKEEFNEERPYVPQEIRTPGGDVIQSADLPKGLASTPHILVQGEPGTGKTELLKHVLKDYCSHPTLREAYKRHGFIPIMIPLREFGNPTDPGDHTTIPNLAQAALRGKGMWFSDSDFLEGLIDREDFLIILDGLNEVNIDKQIIRFAATTGDVKLLMTSQTALPESKEVQTYHLSTFTPDFAKALLAAFIQPDQAARVDEETPEGFWNDIKSGYDVRLIQNLINAGHRVPSNRLELYAATTDYASTKFSGNYPFYVLYERAWNMWKEKTRRFEPDAELPDTLINPLVEARILVARGDQYEFRHDLMRGYLAACWLVREAVSVDVTEERLGEEEVWELSYSEQKLVFPFLAEMISTEKDLEQVAQFASDDVTRRMCLLAECQRAAKTKGWSVRIHLNKASDDLLQV